jgi:hypothetical protein
MREMASSMVEGMRYSNLLTVHLLLKKFGNSGILEFWNLGIRQFLNSRIPEFAIAFFPV